jgi:hypothetical protein
VADGKGVVQAVEEGVSEFAVHSRQRDPAAFRRHVRQRQTIRFFERVEKPRVQSLSPALAELPP